MDATAAPEIKHLIRETAHHLDPALDRTWCFDEAAPHVTFGEPFTTRVEECTCAPCRLKFAEAAP